MTDWLDKAGESLEKRAEEVDSRDRQLKWEPDKRDKLIGILRRTDVATTAFGAGLVLIVEDLEEKDADGEPAAWKVWAPTVMRRELWDVAPAIDGGIAIEKGEKGTSAAGYKFDRYYVSAETPDLEYWGKVQAEYDALEARLVAAKVNPVQSGMEAPF